MAWHKMKIHNVSKIEKVAAEFVIWMIGIIPGAKVKIKIFESQDGGYTGFTNVKIIRKFDNSSESAVGFGKSVDESLENTINYFLSIINNDYPEELYPEGLSEEHIEYVEDSDF
ncbi:hypothetical protein CDR68_24955 [Salmonella enterica]|nr:hypothetical protein [Salmonella enterica]